MSRLAIAAALAREDTPETVEEMASMREGIARIGRGAEPIEKEDDAAREIEQHGIELDRAFEITSTTAD